MPNDDLLRRLEEKRQALAAAFTRVNGDLQAPAVLAVSQEIDCLLNALTDEWHPSVPLPAARGVLQVAEEGVMSHV